MLKVESAKAALLQINPNCQIYTYHVLFDKDLAMSLVKQYDVVLDCTDNVVTRYLLNDVCVLAKKPLVSGSALQMDGQLTVYNYDETGPCYRCLFPVPPPPETITNCGDGGVLGAITGVIGSLQAMEAIKILVGAHLGEVMSGRLLIYDGARCSFRNIKLRARRADCDICSAKATIKNLSQMNYEQFCCMQASDKNMALELLTDSQRISVQQLQKQFAQVEPFVLIDVRSAAEYEICRLPGSINIPIKNVLDNKMLLNENDNKDLLDNNEIPLIMLCRRGNDSQIAVQHLQNKYPNRKIVDVIGGLHAWHKQIDKNFPIY